MTWPIDSPKHGSYLHLQREVAGFLFSVYDVSSLGHEKQSLIDSIIQRGVRNVYAPPPLPNERTAHEWSFLRPIYPLTTEADDYDYDLPDDFVSIYGPLTYSPDSDTLYLPVQVIGEHQLRMKLRDGSYTGRPSLAAYRPKPHDPTTGTRYELLLYPVPDDEYTLHVPMRVNPGPLSEARPFPYGGDLHAELFRESCLREAETHRGQPGPHEGRFLERLVAAVHLDRSQAAPDSLGLNADTGDQPTMIPLHGWDSFVTTYEGVEY